MAGMLPGVECARKRRLHQSVAGGPESANLAANGGTRRSYLSLYPTNNETHHTTFSLMKQQHQAYQDVELGGVAKEARERLDERLKLRTQRKSETKRDNSNIKGCLRCVEELQRDKELYESKKSGSKLLNWAKFSWNVSVEGKCAVCI